MYIVPRFLFSMACMDLRWERYHYFRPPSLAPASRRPGAPLPPSILPSTTAACPRAWGLVRARLGLSGRRAWRCGGPLLDDGGRRDLRRGGLFAGRARLLWSWVFVISRTRLQAAAAASVAVVGRRLWVWPRGCRHPTVAGAPCLSAGAWTRKAGMMAAHGWFTVGD